MRYIIGAILIVSAMSAVAQECVYQSRTVTSNSTEISERSQIVRDVTNVGNGNRIFRVNFSVRINQDWHMATGEWEWSGNRPHQ